MFRTLTIASVILLGIAAQRSSGQTRAVSPSVGQAFQSISIAGPYQIYEGDCYFGTGQPYVLAEIGSREVALAIDTGSIDCVVDPAFIRTDHLRLEKLGMQGAEKLEDVYCDPPRIRVGPFDLQLAERCKAADLSNLRKYANKPPLAGLIGASMLRDCVVRFASSTRKFKILLSDRKPHPEWGIPHPLSHGRVRTRASLKVDGVPTVCFIDSGFNGFVQLPDDRFGLLTSQFGLKLATAPIEGYRLTEPVTHAILPALSIEDRKYLRVPAIEAIPGWTLLGSQYLFACDATVDFGSDTFYESRQNGQGGNGDKGAENGKGPGSGKRDRSE